MSKQINKPLALAVGAALVGGIALSTSAFAVTDLSSGYMVAASQSPGEAGKKDAEGKCGEGKCGIEVMDADKDGKVSSAEFAAKHDGDTTKFAAHDANKDGFITADEVKAHKEGKCGGEKKDADAKKADMEGKCGEGKCGGMA
jgi:uncharacterized low-complexity protein